MEVKKPSRELSVGEILSQTFSLYSNRLVDFYVPFLIVGIVTALLSMALDIIFQPPSQPAELGELLSYLGMVLVYSLLTAIIAWVLSTVVQGIAVKYASDLIEGKEADLGRGLDFTLSKLLSLLGAGFVTIVLIAIGLALFVIPGVILAIMFSLVVPAIMIEDKSAFESLGRSKQLVSGRWLVVFVVLLVVLLTIFAVGLIISFLCEPLGPIGSVVSSIFTAFVWPLLPISMTLLYYSMLARESPAPTQEFASEDEVHTVS